MGIKQNFEKLADEYLLSWCIEDDQFPDLVLDMTAKDGFAFTDGNKNERTWMYKDDGMTKIDLWVNGIDCIKNMNKL
jgi:hypothetical protein